MRVLKAGLCHILFYIIRRELSSLIFTQAYDQATLPDPQPSTRLTHGLVLVTIIVLR